MKRSSKIPQLLLPCLLAAANATGGEPQDSSDHVLNQAVDAGLSTALTFSERLGERVGPSEATPGLPPVGNPVDVPKPLPAHAPDAADEVSAIVRQVQDLEWRCERRRLVQFACVASEDSYDGPELDSTLFFVLRDARNVHAAAMNLARLRSEVGGLRFALSTARAVRRVPKGKSVRVGASLYPKQTVDSLIATADAVLGRLAERINQACNDAPGRCRPDAESSDQPHRRSPSSEAQEQRRSSEMRWGGPRIRYGGRLQ